MKKGLAMLVLVACSKPSALPSIAADDAAVVQPAMTDDAAIASATISTDAASGDDAGNAVAAAIDAGGPKNSNKCPRARPNGACTQAALDTECAYPPKSSCLCTTTSCVTPAGPIPDCKSSDVWMCRDDGCPMVMRGACTNEGKRCDSDNGMCMFHYVCKNGTWLSNGQGQCRPAAPPHGGDAP